MSAIKYNRRTKNNTNRPNTRMRKIMNQSKTLSELGVDLMTLKALNKNLKIEENNLHNAILYSPLNYAKTKAEKRIYKKMKIEHTKIKKNIKILEEDIKYVGNKINNIQTTTVVRENVFKNKNAEENTKNAGNKIDPTQTRTVVNNKEKQKISRINPLFNFLKKELDNSIVNLQEEIKKSKSATGNTRRPVNIMPGNVQKTLNVVLENFSKFNSTGKINGRMLFIIETKTGLSKTEIVNNAEEYNAKKFSNGIFLSSSLSGRNRNLSEQNRNMMLDILKKRSNDKAVKDKKRKVILNFLKSLEKIRNTNNNKQISHVGKLISRPTTPGCTNGRTI